MNIVEGGLTYIPMQQCGRVFLDNGNLRKDRMTVLFFSYIQFIVYLFRCPKNMKKLVQT